jgi:hypothetical protein
MAQSPLDLLVIEQQATVEQQEETNLHLDQLDDRFLDFFRQMARDRMDLMEMLREQKSGNDDGKETSENKSPEEPDKSNPFGLGTMLMAAAATLGAFFINSLGGVFLDKIPGALKSIGGKLAEVTKSIGETVGKTFEKMKTSVVSKAKDMGAAIKNFAGEKVAKGVETAKNIAGSVSDKAKSIGSGIKGFFNSGVDKVKGIGSGIAEKAGGFVESVKNSEIVSKIKESEKLKSVIGFMKGSGETIAKTAKIASKIAAPLAVITSAADGYSMASEETEDMKKMNDVSKIALQAATGAAGAASSFFGGFADFVKLVTVDAAIEAGQRLGVVSENGYLQKVQDVSIQRDITDIAVRSGRDALASALATETAAASSAKQMSAPIIINNSTTTSAPTSNTTVLGGSSSTSAVSNNGTRGDAWAGA